MRHIAEYIPHHTAPADAKPYFRTVWGDDINEAVLLAERYCRKGYILKKVIKEE